MSLIDKSYFIGELSISQISQPAVEELLTVFINRYEPQFLTDILGYGFQKLFLANLTQPRFVALRDGAEFTDPNGSLHKFYGIANATTKNSPIANFVFYKYVRDKYEQQRGIATVSPKAENATVIAPEYTLIKAYNDMVDYIHVLRQYLHAEKDTYPEYDVKYTKCFETLNHYGI